MAAQAVGTSALDVGIVDRAVGTSALDLGTEGVHIILMMFTSGIRHIRCLRVILLSGYTGHARFLLRIAI